MLEVFRKSVYLKKANYQRNLRCDFFVLISTIFDVPQELELVRHANIFLCKFAKRSNVAWREVSLFESRIQSISAKCCAYRMCPDYIWSGERFVKLFINFQRLGKWMDLLERFVYMVYSRQYAFAKHTICYAQRIANSAIDSVLHTPSSFLFSGGKRKIYLITYRQQRQFDTQIFSPTCRTRTMTMRNVLFVWRPWTSLTKTLSRALVVIRYVCLRSSVNQLQTTSFVCLCSFFSLFSHHFINTFISILAHRIIKLDLWLLLA